ncbi:MAG: hypothetical protein QW567_01130 [Candidatus Hadarchaeales archaeon]
MMENRGSAALLAFFAIFVIVSSVAAVYMFEAGYRVTMGAMGMRTATDATRAMLRSIEWELNKTLKTSIEAAMFDIGRIGGTKEAIIRATRENLNSRIDAGWEYHNFEAIEVPRCNENSLSLTWLPDGSLQATGYLNSTVTHISGIRGFGTRLSVGAVPRYGRMYYLAHMAYEEAMRGGNAREIESRYNEKYACELFTFLVETIDGRIRVTVKDDYAGEALAG